ncbi:MFS transporter [Actinomadura graeca]|uniref:MFS transporter n=1 Tax=Actinomadura graeca TaxID=2750812 RepID=A0ABX8QQG1_9ACTN|nr:MFS transporter [Actinomadura graeca]QXJ20987.1 MFS transporter [Actinomadura graeca]
MSDVLLAAPPVPAHRPRLMSRPLALVFLCAFGTMTGFYLLLSVVPLYAASSGAGGVAAGLATGSLMLSTVAAELVVPRLVTRYGYRPVLAGGVLLLGLPPLALPLSAGMGVVVAVGLVRGLGFAVAVVVAGALVATLVPAERRGEGLGLSGIVVGVPAVLALPLGVWLAGHTGFTCVFVAGSAAALAVLPAALALPGRPPESASRRALGVLGGLRCPALLRPAAAFAASAAAAGIVVTFLPASAGGAAAGALLVQAAAATASRWWAGRFGDRHGAGRLLLPGLLAAAAGMGGLALPGGPVVTVASMALFGAGFGVMQNASIAVMYDRVPVSGYGAVSAVWNLSYDGAMGAGGAGFGLAAAWAGYPAAFVLTGAVMLLALPLARRA